jgi:tetratricopeptide (TPR) repeat protein
LYPSQKRIPLTDGTFTYCDGYQILKVLKFRRDHKQLLSACNFYDAKNYGGASRLFETLNPNFIGNDILNIVIESFNKNKDYDGAKQFYSKLLNVSNREQPDANNLCNMGVVESNLGNNEQAMIYYNNSLVLDNNNIYALANRGYTYNLFENYANALTDFNKAIEINPEFAYAYSNRAYTKIKLRQFDDAITDINKAISIDEKEAYAYRNLGIYFLEIKDFAKAGEQLQIAFELNPDTHLIDDYIKIVEEKIGGITAV